MLMERLLTLLATIPPGCSHGFLGLEPWYNFLQVSNPPSCQVQNFYIFPGGGNSSSVPLVLVAIVDDLLRIAGIIAVGFVIYGAIKFIASEGNPDATTQARGTV